MCVRRSKSVELEFLYATEVKLLSAQYKLLQQVFCKPHGNHNENTTDTGKDTEKQIKA